MMETFLFFLQTPIELVVTNFTYNFNSSLLNITLRQREQFFNGTIEILRRIPNMDGTVELMVSLSSKVDFNFRTIYKRTINICKFFASPKKEFLLNLAYQQMNKDGKFPNHCPIEPVKKKDFIVSFAAISPNYYFLQMIVNIRDLTMDSAYFPPLPINFHFKVLMNSIFYFPKRVKAFDAVMLGKIRNKKS